MRLFVSLIAVVLLPVSLTAQQTADRSKKILSAQSWAGQLVAELEYVRASLRAARGQDGRDFAARADLLAKEGSALYRNLDADRRPDQMMRDYQRFDRGL